MLDPLVLRLYRLGHFTGNGNFFIAGKRLAHVRQRQKRRFFQQEPRKHQRRNARKLARPNTAFLRSALCGIVFIGFGVGCFHNAILCIEQRGLFMRLSVRQHQLRRRAVEQMKNAGAVAVDERGRHADDLFCRAKQLCHGIALSAVVVVLVQLIHDETVEPAAVPLLDVRAERIPPARAARREIPVRVLVKRQQRIQRGRVLRLLHGMDCQLPMHPAVFRNLDPRRRYAWIYRCPQGTVATHTLMIAPVLHAERLRFCSRPAVLFIAAWQLYDFSAAGAAERAFPRVKQDSRASHIAVSGFFLADNGADAFVALPVLRVQAVQLHNAADNDAHGIRQCFGNFTHPLLCDVRRTKNDVERLFPFLRLIRRQRGRADLRLAAAALSHNERGFSLRELALDRFRDSKLRRVKAVACVCADIVVDAQNLRGKLLRGRVKQRLELLSDTLCDGHAERA